MIAMQIITLLVSTVRGRRRRRRFVIEHYLLIVCRVSQKKVSGCTVIDISKATQQY